MSRVFAREAAQKVGQEGVRWVAGSVDAGSPDVAALLAAIPHDAIRAAQAGLLADMDRVADVLYGRSRLTRRRDHPILEGPPHAPTSTPFRPSPSSASRRSCPRPPTPRPSGPTSGRVATRVTDVPPERWDPALYFSLRPRRARQDLLEDRRLGARVSRGTRSAGSCRSRPRWPTQMDVGQQMGRERRALRPARCRLAAVEDRPRPRRRDPRQRDRRRQALPLDHAHRAARGAARPGAAPEHARRCPPRSASASSKRRAPPSSPAVPRSTRTRMPGELSNVMAGRIANLFNLRGPNFTTDAACASGLAALSAAVEGLVDHRFDAAITGGVDRNMSVAGFVKFCKIGALSATGTRPFDAGADGFVMGEGAALVRAQASRGRRARRRPDLRRHPRRRRLQRRQGQGHHGPQPGRPAPGGAAGLGTGRGRPGHRLGHRSARHLHARRRCHRAREPDGRVRRGRSARARRGARAR